MWILLLLPRSVAVTTTPIGVIILQDPNAIMAVMLGSSPGTGC